MLGFRYSKVTRRRFFSNPHRPQKTYIAKLWKWKRVEEKGKPKRGEGRERERETRSDPLLVKRGMEINTENHARTFSVTVACVKYVAARAKTSPPRTPALHRSSPNHAQRGSAADFTTTT